MMKERSDCEKVATRIIEGVLRHMVPFMKVDVRTAMIGEKPFDIRVSRQTTLHDFMELGIARNEDEIYQHLDVSINKRILLDPDMSEQIVNLLNQVEMKLEQIRLME